MTRQATDSALLTAIMDAAVDAMIVADETGTMLRANTAAGRLFGHAPEDLVGQSVNLLMPADMADRHDGFMRHHIATGERRIIGRGREVEGRRKDGTVFPLHLSVGHTQVAQRSLFVGILHDLTERRAAQEALARSQRLDAIGQLTGGIAHDFNNLLTVIIGNLELLEMRGTQDRNVALIRDALASAEMGADLTSRLLVFARKGNLKPVRVDLRALCADTLAILQRTIGETYRIRTEFADGPCEAMIDPVQLQSALINLALNARDAMPGGGNLLISVARIAIDSTYLAQETDIAPGSYVRLLVSDNGTGMTVAAQRRAFEPFFTTKSASGGSGLGLAMVYGFVRQSGGHITLYSEPGHGSSFGLYFPAIDEAGAIAASDGDDGDGAITPRGAGQTVLVVEDNPRLRRLSIERVRDLGYRTAEAESGDAAYAMMQAGAQVDLVFSDLVMPGALNGYDLAARIRASHPHVPVLLTSGYASDVVSGRIDPGETHDVLHKPYRQAELAQRLQALLAGDDPDGARSTSAANI
ncbi:MAG: PAS domain S-box protein [Rhodobacteraceae bacterium]|nr:PAS domain S-box protein [Paracoccaceae bacterium]